MLSNEESQNSSTIFEIKNQESEIQKIENKNYKISYGLNKVLSSWVEIF